MSDSRAEKDFVGCMMLLVQAGLSIQQLSKALEQRGNLTLAQWYVLRNLINVPGVSAQDLAGILGVHPSTLTQSLKRLSSRKLIFISEDPRDSRRKVIGVTRAGKDALEHMEGRMRDRLDGIDGFASELQRLQEFLRGLSD